jgi:ATP-dependent helicase HrpB
MQPLPIDSHLSGILDALRRHRAIVVVAEPGAGKTTRLPPAVLAAGLLSRPHPHLVMLQPRRVAARAAAMRIAQENNWHVGREVGYHVRFDRRVSRETRLRVLTEGILTRQLLDDPGLSGIGAVVLDEFHERSIHTDMAIALLCEIRKSLRPDLLLIVMSATLDAASVSQFLGDCPVVQVPGRVFPVTVTHTQPAARQIEDRIADALAALLDSPADDHGDVLIFLPGAGEIRRSIDAAASMPLARDCLLLPLHGSLPPHQQLLALDPTPGRRKIIFATNIAETSLTIPGVTAVIDSGLARIPDYDPRRGLDRLSLLPISQASAAQRAGRAGRTAPGRCLRLWSAKEHQSRAAFAEPEILRCDLAATVLCLHAWGHRDPQSFAFFQPPRAESLLAAEQLLRTLGAIDAAGRLTPLGSRMAAVAAHPRLARLLLAAEDAGYLDTGAAVAALLLEPDLMLDSPADRAAPRRDRAPATRSSSDVLLRLAALDRAERQNFSSSLFSDGIDPAAARQVALSRDHLLNAVPSHRHSPRESGSSDDLTLRRLLLLAYPDRVCRRRESDPSAATMVGGSGLRLDPSSTVRDGEFFLAIDARRDDRSPAAQAIVRIASRIELTWLAETFPDLVHTDRELIYDEATRRVITRATTRFIDLAVKTHTDSNVEPHLAGPILAAALRPTASSLFADDESSASLIARIAFLREHMPEHPWPALSEDQLPEILDQACQGCRSLAEVQGRLADALRNSLPHALSRLLDTQAPTTIQVPTGNRIAVQYALGKPPVLAVRLQELFGLRDTPRLAAGRMPVLLHLLAPNYRPVQITDDLYSFFSTTYFQVRKDLKARYPKHSWPDDPFTAVPQSKGSRRQR